MRTGRLLALLLVVSAVVGACSDGDETVYTVSSGGNGTSSSGQTGTSSGKVPGGDEPVPVSSSSSGAVPGGLDLDSIVTLTAKSDTCGRPANQCFDAQAITVDFLKSTLSVVTCVEVAGAPDAGPAGTKTKDATTSHPLSPADVTAIKARLAALKTTSGAFGRDAAAAAGTPLESLQLTTRSGTVLYVTADTLCAPEPKTPSIVFGWDELWKTLIGL